MFNAHGWICVRSSRSAYTANLPNDLVDELDETINNADERLWDELEAHLSAYGVDSEDVYTFEDGLEIRPIELSLIKWNFYRHFNNMNGLLTLVTSRNHRCNHFIDLVNWIAKKGEGSYGIIYVHDNEDENSSNEFKVWRILKGEVEEFSDKLLSPVVPLIQNEPF